MLLKYIELELVGIFFELPEELIVYKKTTLFKADYVQESYTK
jgi:hypothetical protein